MLWLKISAAALLSGYVLVAIARFRLFFPILTILSLLHFYIIGGAKISSKIQVLSTLANQVDEFFIGLRLDV